MVFVGIKGREDLRRAFWCLRLRFHPAMLHVRALAGKAAFFQWHSTKTYMGSFEGDTEKPMTLYSNAPWTACLARGRPGEFVATNKETISLSVSSDGRRQVTGGKGLKRTQAYTEAFGAAVVDAYVFGAAGFDEHEYQFNVEAEDALGNEEAWVKADLPAVLDFMTGP